MPNLFDTDHLPDVFRGSEARKAGLITEGQLRGNSVRRLFQDVYAPARLEVTHELRCRGAALLVPEEAVLTGRSAATLMGVELAKPYDPVEFVVPEKHRFGPIAGIKVRRTEVTKDESTPWQSTRIARPDRVALDLLLRLSPRARSWVRRLRIGVPDLDAFLRAGYSSMKRLEQLCMGRRNRGIRLARNALQLADPRAESLPESELRIVLAAGGISAKSQHVVRTKQGDFLGRLDLALAECKVAIEYDGRWHDTSRQRKKDQRRRKRIAEAGWRFIIVTAEQLANDFAGIVTAVTNARDAQLAR